MNTIPALPSLAQSLLALSSQTRQRAASTPADSDSPPAASAPGADTLALGSALSGAAQAVALQNGSSILADPAAALAATQSAASFIAAQPAQAQLGQGSPSAQAVFNLI